MTSNAAIGLRVAQATQVLVDGRHLEQHSVLRQEIGVA